MDETFELFCDLVANLRSRSVALRREAIAAIGLVADRSCTNILLEAIQGEPDVQVRSALVRTLGKIATPNLIPVLAEYLGDPDPRCRSNTIEALACFSLQADEVVGLIRPLVSDPSNRVVGTAIRVLHAFGDRAVTRLLAAMLRGDDNARRCSAIWAVGELGLEEELPTIVEYLGSIHYRVHTIAAQVVRKFGSRAVPALLGALGTADRFRRAYIVMSLGDIGDPAALDALRSALDERDEMVRMAAISALGRLGLPQAVEALVGFLVDASFEIRLETLKALKSLGVPSAAAAVRHLCDNERDPRVLSAAATALGALGSTDSLEALRRLLGHPDPRVRANAVEALGQIGDRQIVHELAPFLDDPNGRVFANAAIALSEFGEVDVLGLLKTRLASSDAGVRASAAYALGEIPLEGVVELLVRMIQDRSARVRRRVLEGLLRKGAAAREALAGAIDRDESLLDTEGTMIAAARLGIRSVLQPLIRRFLRPAPVVPGDGRARVSGMFEQLRQRIDAMQIHLARRVRHVEPEVIDGLRELLADEDPQTRCFAVQALAEVGGRDVLGTILCVLHDLDPSVRAYAVDALSRVGDRRCVTFLRACLADRERGVRLRVVRLLASLGVPECIADLERARAGSDSDLRAEIDRAVETIRGRTGQPPAQATVDNVPRPS